jgi:hypothetical protein
MNNRPGMMTSLLALGATGAAIYGITRGVKNGTFQQLPETISNVLNNQQMKKPLQGMMNNQQVQQLTEPLEGMMDNQSLQQLVKDQNPLS